MAVLINQTVQEDGNKLDNIIQQQQDHLEKINTKINVDLITTEKYQDSMCQKVCLYSAIFLFILLAVIGLMVYMKKD